MASGRWTGAEILQIAYWRRGSTSIHFVWIRCTLRLTRCLVRSTVPERRGLQEKGCFPEIDLYSPLESEQQELEHARYHGHHGHVHYARSLDNGSSEELPFLCGSTDPAPSPHLAHTSSNMTCTDFHLN